MKPKFTDDRIELKYQLSAYEYFHFFERWLYSLNCSVTKPYPVRKIQNIYFDDLLLSSTGSNLFGYPTKKKLRLRWYNDDESTSQLELKTKKDDLVTKYIFDSTNFSKDTDGSLSFFYDNFHPTIYNEYKREYFLVNGNVRITLDKELKFSSAQRDSQLISCEHFVLEVKYPKETHSDILKPIMKSIPFTRTKFSKYFSGFETSYL